MGAVPIVYTNANEQLIPYMCMAQVLLESNQRQFLKKSNESLMVDRIMQYRDNLISRPQNNCMRECKQVRERIGIVTSLGGGVDSSNFTHSYFF